MRPAPGFKKQATQFQELETLRLLMPPTGLVFVGAGNGVGPLHQWQQWDITAVTLVDADIKKLAWAEKHPQSSNWNILECVVGKAAEETPYYHASNTEEDGTINPLLLKSIWPNLQINQEEVRKLQPLTDLLSIDVQQQANWILVDCLPALDILSSAEAMLGNLEVVCARVLLNHVDEMPEACTLQALQSWAEPLALELIRVVETNNPAVGYAVLAKNWKHVLKPKLSASNQQVGELKAVIKTLEEARDELKNGLEASKQAVVQHQHEITELKTTADIQARETEQLKSASVELGKENGELKAQLESGKQQVEKLTQERDAQTKLATDRQGQIGALTNERDEARKQAADAKGQIESLTKARDEQTKLATDHQAQVATLTKERDDARKQAADAKGLIEQLTKASEDQVKIAKMSENQNNMLRNECDELYKQNEQLIKERNKVSEQNLEYKNKIDQISLSIEVNTNQFTSLENKLIAAQSQIKGYEEQIDKLENEINESCKRQQLFRDEITRAEAQIELITNVLIREPRL
jgi:chromosome segregation ATPase